jgi:hypothetical protein
MKRLLLTAVCAFGLVFSTALAQEKTQEQLREESGHIWSVDGLKKTQYRKIVASGTDTRIGAFTFVNPDCTAEGNVSIRVTKQPEHGTVESSTTTYYPNYPKENLRYKCNQHKVKGTQIRYKSAEKYVGDDALDALVLFSDGYAWEVHFDIDIR